MVLVRNVHKRNKTLFKRNVQTCLKEITIHAISAVLWSSPEKGSNSKTWSVWALL